MWRQCVPHLVHRNRRRQHTGALLIPAESLWIYRPSDMSRHVRAGLFLSSKLPLHVWGFGSQSSLGPPDSLSRRHLERFSRVPQLTPESRYILCNGPPLSFLKITPSHGDLDPYLIRGSLVHPSQHPARHNDQFSRFCTARGRDRQTDRPTDHATPSVAIGRIFYAEGPRNVSRNVDKCCTTVYEQCHWKRLAISEWRWGSLKVIGTGAIRDVY